MPKLAIAYIKVKVSKLFRLDVFYNIYSFFSTNNFFQMHKNVFFFGEKYCQIDFCSSKC